MNHSLLEQVQTPHDLRRLPESSLPAFCAALRTALLENVAQTGGHLASGLGVVELTVALHYVFDTPDDSLIWDVGHQAYPHKMLTERRLQMHTMKKMGGLSGFPKRDESPYDNFGVGHSSTSISAALGMAIADQLAGDEQRQHVAIIGDGAMTAGMAFEALHHAASLSANILVILNDNDMSISPNVGGLSDYLSQILVSDLYQEVREKSKAVLKHLPPFNDLAKFAESQVKAFVGGSNLFEDLGFAYTGPVDGHDVLALVEILRRLKQQTGPRLLHVKTKKGKGYARAEAAPITYHGVGQFDLAHGITPKPVLDPAKVEKPTFTEVFSAWLCDMAARDERLVGITPAMREGSGLVAFSERFPNRYFDVAIAEQHAVTLAAGMACRGLKPVVAIYSTFLQRAYDQLIHDVALQNLDVLFAIDRGGIVGEDGATHAGVFDLAYSRLIPNLVIMTPSDEQEAFKLLNTGFAYNGPALVRYPKGNGALGQLIRTDETVPIGQGKIVRAGKNLAILAFGTLRYQLQESAEKWDSTLVDMRFVKPLDEALILNLAKTHSKMVVVEEGSALGGVGEQIATLIAQKAKQVDILPLALADKFPEHGKREEILDKYGLSAAALFTRINDFIHDKSN